MSDFQPIRFEIDTANRLRRAIFTGLITEPILLQSYTELLSDIDYDSTLNDLVDMTNVERLEVAGSGVRDLVDMFTKSGAVSSTKLALVAPLSHVFGLSRMYEMMSEGTSEQIQVFSDLKEAEEWLGIAPSNK